MVCMCVDDIIILTSEVYLKLTHNVLKVAHISLSIPQLASPGSIKLMLLSPESDMPAPLFERLRGHRAPVSLSREHSVT